jgi:natural product precursor
MTIISKLKLTQLSKAELKARELNTLKGGYCVCDDNCYCRGCNPEIDSLQFTGNYNGQYMSYNAGDQVDVGGDNLGYDPKDTEYPDLYA